MCRNEHAVSPVVGVMLMLSVTIIIAAIVSATAGSYSGTQKSAPSGVLEVHFYENRSYGSFSTHTMTIEHISGAPLQTKDLSISTYFRNESGQLIKGTLSGEMSVEIDSGHYSAPLFINDQDRFEGSPLQHSSSARHRSWFGNSSAVLMAGDVLVTPAQFCGSVDGHENPGLNTLLNLGEKASDDGYKAGDVITVKIVHIPSGQVIFDKDVVVV
ncbi:type IV pilin N-terminal domain-containing protein [Methanoregula sp.]|uniref:type IV pilin N-terminal domain-containing protein n=1 Tax=Methanoregula sp. TaxID=2052170 RepID=UPI00262F76BA|nr:type IV pilin N-terminal domain-containing protein [Methanoregula sp.]MDD5143626.1 type IV pilin N-terminal domain-containing protein [Methanoregula sp.]